LVSIMAKCMCGAVIKVPHTGNCHFGWHNPDTCPQLNCPRDHRNTPSGNKITADEKKEIEDMILGEVDRIIQDGGWAAQNIIKYLKSIGYRADDD
jgi:hypothetical protein